MSAILIIGALPMIKPAPKKHATLKLISITETRVANKTALFSGIRMDLFTIYAFSAPIGIAYVNPRAIPLIKKENVGGLATTTWEGFG
jgi:hypothetical protein